MKVLVSGGTGLVGRYIVERLLAAGYQVTVGGRTPPVPALFSGQVGFIPLSLDPDIDQTGALEGIDHFVHAAFDHIPGLYRGGEGHDPEGFRRRNLDGSVRLFRSAREVGVKRCVFLSSRAVYDGLPGRMALSEEAVLTPTTLYGEVKLSAENVLGELSASGFIGSSLRATGVYGDLRPGKWDGLLADYLSGRSVAARAGSEVHGRDVASAVLILLESDPEQVTGQSFNISDIVTDTRTLLSIAQAETGCTHALPDAADVSGVSSMETAKLRALGWAPGGRGLFEATVRELARSALPLSA